MFENLQRISTEVGSHINACYLGDEATLIADLAERAECSDQQRRQIEATAIDLVGVMRKERAAKSGLDAFLFEYDLSSTEGVVLMCLAEALLRIPDPQTADLLIADRLAAGDWESHLGESGSLFVNASTWGLMLTGNLVQPEDAMQGNLAEFMRRLVSRVGEPVVRSAMMQAMRIMAQQFVMGRDIEEAMRRTRSSDLSRYRFSYDMLGEAAQTSASAEDYFDAYLHAINAIGAHVGARSDVLSRQSISIKLSALSPRLELAQRDRVMDEVVPRLSELAATAKRHNVALTVDAEEASRLEMTLAIFAVVFDNPAMQDWEGLGIAVQAYQRRARAVIKWLRELSERSGRRIPVRLVKGAYWDTEIKRSQELGLESYPVFTRKVNTDVSYLACARDLLDAGGVLLPQFATHNAHTVAYIMHTAAPGSDYEFQRLHGMGEALYDQILNDPEQSASCRIYAPVGPHEDLLPYLVRRLLENGANTSFINRIVQEDAPVAELVQDPVLRVKDLAQVPNSAINAPTDLYGPERTNSAGLNLHDGAVLSALGDRMEAALDKALLAQPIIDGKKCRGEVRISRNPIDHRRELGRVGFSTSAQVDRALEVAHTAFPDWDATGVAQRAGILRRAADLFEQSRPELMALCVAEAGKCIPDALAEVREAVDFLRYYAVEAERLMSEVKVMPGPTGEQNELSVGGRGVLACISPWNFPLAIFSGQIAAALVTGNTVLAKPAEQTSLVAFRAVELFLEAGIPEGVLQFLPGEGGKVGAQMAADGRVCGVVFTGSTQTALRINRTLAARDGPLATLIAETGGQNAMLVDSTALVEQVVTDAVYSAFNSAGQRCSALRVLLLQEEIADRVMHQLAGNMAELRLGNPAALNTDVGPVIDFAARDALLKHRSEILKVGKLVYECKLPAGLEHGSFVTPMIVEIPYISTINKENFGPILHIVRFRREQLDDILEAVAATGFGLTFGVQSRIERRAQRIAERVPVGNIYINRNMVGAVVGVQPFGGRGLSGTGPKAGGPHYLQRFVTERTISVNTAAVGGNATLLGLTKD